MKRSIVCTGANTCSPTNWLRTVAMVVLAASMIAVMVSSGAFASYTLTDSNSSITIDPLSTTGMDSWVVDGTNQLKTQWWYYRIGQNAQASIHAIGTPTVTQLAPNILNVVYPSSVVDFTVRYTLVGGSAGSGNSTIAESVRVRNKSGAPMVFHLFEYNDIDLMNTPMDDTAVRVNAANITQWDGSTIATETAAVGGITPAPGHWEIGHNWTILTKLQGPAPADLGDLAAPLDNWNAAFAFQWDMNIATGATQLLSKSKILMRSGSIGDTVWYDRNADGLQRGDEFGIPNVKVNLQADLNGDGIAEYTTSMTTDQSGNYLFGNLPAGHYTISIDASTLPGGMVPTYDADGISTVGTSVLNLASGQINLDQDFGYTGTGSTSGVLFVDYNANGVKDPGEPGLPDLTVVLKDANGNLVTMTTGSDGSYSFKSMPAGSFTVSVDPAPTGHLQTYDLDGTLDNATAFSLAVGQNKTDVNFGYTGTQASVSLEKTGPSSATVGDTVTYHFKVTNTGNTGFYGLTITDPMFGNSFWSKTPVLPGEVNEFDATYVVQLIDAPLLTNAAAATGVLPIGLAVTSQSAWSMVVVTPATASIVGTVFRDANANAVWDLSENGFIDWVVTLLDIQGNVIATSTTDAMGAYSFGSLFPGDYVVQVTPAAGYAETYDLDGVMDNYTTVSLGVGQHKENVDFGYTGTQPGVDIVKTGPATAKVGDTITYHFVVTNTGNTYLFGGVTVNDPKLGGNIWHKTPVAPGEVNEFDKTYVVKSTDGPLLVNTASAIGCPPVGTSVTESSSCTTSVQSAGRCSHKTYHKKHWCERPKGRVCRTPLRDNWKKVYKCGYVAIGRCSYMKFDTPEEIEEFLDEDDSPGWHDWRSSRKCPIEDREFARQTLCLRLNVDFSKCGVTPAGLESDKVPCGELSGQTVGEVLKLAEEVLGGNRKAIRYGLTLSDVRDAVKAINDYYDED